MVDYSMRNSAAEVVKSLDTIDGSCGPWNRHQNSIHTVVIAGETELRTVTLQTSAAENGGA
ncbi:unnamed protein product [Arabis nemorensis]|uniref:Uncharacterized protein n=1 Tax=Arabis nemorensis TaxID=586526 RepID=A0A565C2R1_9BRAS|nr:unnamed protein product [Arabis nemorensis]